MQWRVEIGVFGALCDVRYTIKFSCSSHSASKKAAADIVLIFTLFLLFMSGDIELNPGLNIVRTPLDDWGGGEGGPFFRTFI